jgi:hypothetical protein
MPTKINIPNNETPKNLSLGSYQTGLVATDDENNDHLYM